MKKAILSPLCSAFVVPGMGQLLNQHLKKGGLMLAAVFILMVLFVVRIFQMIVSVLEADTGLGANPTALLDKILAKNPFFLYVVFVILGILWVYSVIDAWWGGMKQDRQDEGKKA